MMKKLLAIAVILLLCLNSCVSKRKVQTINNDISRQKQEQVALLQKVDSIDKRREAKKEAGELDEKTDSMAYQYIRELKDSVQHRIQQYDALLADDSRKGKDVQKKKDYYNYVSTLYKSDLENVLYFDDLLAANTYAKLNTAVFFGPGQYAVSDTTQAKQLLGDVINQVMAFAAKYPSRTLYASFIVLGYADEQDITAGSELYNDLAKSITEPNPSRLQLNLEVSNRRALSILDVVHKQYDMVNEKYKAANLHPSFFAIGKGELLPAGNIKDYKPIDERRRIVLLYWTVLPKLK